MNTLLKKTYRDIMMYKGRTILALIGILIGLSAVGAVMASYSILDREMTKNYMDTNPASIVFEVQNLNDNAIQILKKSNSNLDFEFRKTIQARISRGDGTFGTIYLRAIKEFENQKVDTFTLEQGQFPTKASEMAIERDCLKLLKNIKQGSGENVVIKLPQGLETDIKLSGTVHAPGLAPASMENYSYGFISLDGLKSLGYDGWFDEIRIVNHENRFDREKMQILSENLYKTLVENGYSVKSVNVPIPGKHPHADQLNSLLFMLQAFAIISLIAACLIIINLISFIMSRQAKQIAIMKAFGASTYDTAHPFLFYVILISAVAILLSFPISLKFSELYSNMAANILNFKISSYFVPYWVYILQILIGMLFPLCCTIYPIYKSSKMSVKDGLFERLDNTNQKQTNFKIKMFMPINNLLRKKTRTILAVLALLAGGVLYMASQNIISSIDKTVDKATLDFCWDYNIVLSGNYPEDKIRQTIKTIDGLDSYEIWKNNKMTLKQADGLNSVNCPVKIIPDNSTMINLPQFNKIENQIIVNNGLVKDELWIKQGQTLKAQVNGITADVVVADIVNEVPAIPTIYMNLNTYERLFGTKSGQMILAHANTRDLSEQRKTTKQIEAKFDTDEIKIAENWNVYVLRKAFVDHLFLIIVFLSAISILAIVVGGISIGSAIGINISERKRELGVLRAIGANGWQIVSMVLSEVFIMAIVSWFVGSVISLPLSQLVGNYFGQIFLSANLQNAFSVVGSIQWLVISILVSTISGLIPAHNIALAQLRDMLSYE